MTEVYILESDYVASYLLDAQIGNCLVLIHYCLVPILLRATLVYSYNIEHCFTQTENKMQSKQQKVLEQYYIHTTLYATCLFHCDVLLL